MGNVFRADEKWLESYRERMAKMAQNAQERPATPSAGETDKVNGRRSPIRVKARRMPNQTEERFNRDHLGGRGIYEGVTFNCPGGRYTPDWVTWENGLMFCYEIKGAHAFHSQGRASYAFKDCVARYPAVEFFWAKLEKDWTWTVINGRTGK